MSLGRTRVVGLAAAAAALLMAGQAHAQTYVLVDGDGYTWDIDDEYGRIIWGTDYAGMAMQVKFAVQGFRDFQIPSDMQEGYGYPAITDADRRLIFGENLARLLGVDTDKRRAPFAA